MFHPNIIAKALFSTSLIILAEKVFLQFVAISFHRKALADRLAENHLGLKALDRLSNAHPIPSKKSPYKRGHKNSGTMGSMDFLTYGRKQGKESPGSPVLDGNSTTRSKRRSKQAERKQNRRKAMASIIVDQVGTAIGQLTLKNSKFNRQGELGGLGSARRLARKLFGALSDVTPHRSHLIVDGTLPSLLLFSSFTNSISDFYPYFRSTTEAVSSG